MKNFWETFPRQIAYPNRIFCKDLVDFINRYNELNGVVDKVYVSLYKYDMNNQLNNVEIDVVGLDMDSGVCYETMKEVHEKLIKENIVHQVLFSTRGFWVFVYTTPRIYTKDVARGKIAALQDGILEGTTAFFGKSSEAPVDVAIRGDAERLCRMPTSFDKGRKRYAILLSDDDIALGYDGITKLSRECTPGRRFQITTFCKDGILLDPDNYTAKPVNLGPSEFEDIEYTYEIPQDISEQHKQMMDLIPEYMRPWITNSEAATWQARSYVTLYLRERGFSVPQIKAFLRPFYEKHLRNDFLQNNWNHYEHVKTAELLFKRRDLKMPSFDTLWKLGLVPFNIVEKYGRYNSPAYK